MQTQLENVRIDRWLSAARFYKTRTQAAKACEGGKIKVNGEKAKSHKLLHIGDRLTLHHRGRYRDIEVLGLAERGLPPKEARALYQEETKQMLSDEEEELFSLYRKNQKKQRPKWKGRPTKKERRELEKLKNIF
ncbi:RNA-binding S4 domain-containing protein [bacterium]|nr:RNA-binding S4 domain-containing protein [bacterium]